jgi:hypothetical protein
MTYQIFSYCIVCLFVSHSSSSDIIKNKPVYYSENENVTVVSAEELVYNNLQTNDLAMPSREVLLKL